MNARPAYHSYGEVPWYRRSSTNSALLLLQLLTLPFFPVAVFVCLVLLTGGDLLRQGRCERRIEALGLRQQGRCGSYPSGMRGSVGISPLQEGAVDADLPNKAMHRMSGRHICSRFGWLWVPLIGDLSFGHIEP